MRDYSKTAKKAIRKYIVDNYTAPEAGYEGAPDHEASYEEIARFILKSCKNEKSYYWTMPGYSRVSSFERFLDWCQGLPSVIDTCYFYNRSAVKDVAMILEEPENIAKKYTEEAAERYLTSLIYRELVSVARFEEV